MIAEALRRIKSLEVRQANIISFGKIQSVNLSAARCRVQIGEILTKEIPWITSKAAADESTWWAPSTGEQVVVFAPSGDYAQAVILTGLYQNSAPAPSSDDQQQIIQFGDVNIILNKDGNITITVSGNITVTASDNINLDCPKLTCTGDVIAGGVSLINHVHTGVIPGGSVTGPPAGGA